MGEAPNISHDKFPAQDTGRYAPGSRAVVCFNFDTSHLFGATILRNDTEAPGLMILQLDDGRTVLSTECMWQPSEEKPSKH